MSDDSPCPGYEVVEEAARLLGISAVEEVDFEDANLSEMAKKFYCDSKRVSNKKLKEVLGYKLLFPNHETGLRSILQKTKQS